MTNRFAFLAAACLAGLILSAPAMAADKIDFNTQIRPILRDNCYSCHGAEKKKGKLQLHTKELFTKGGETGDTVVPSKPDGSEMFLRISLDPEHEDIMPPKGDPLTKDQQALLKAWIEQGADFGAWTADHGAEATGGKAATQEVLPKVDPANAQAITALTQIGALAMPLAKDTNLINVDFRAVAADIGDSHLELLSPVAKQVAWLGLARTKVTDAGLAHLAGLKNLRRLHLEKTAIGDAGLAHLAGLAELEYLNLYATQVGDAGLAHLKNLKKLKKIYLWQTPVTDDGAEQLALALPELSINRGEQPSAVVDPNEPRAMLAIGDLTLPKAGEAWRITGIRYEKGTPGPKAEAQLHYRHEGIKKFTAVELARGDDNSFSVTLPADVTNRPFQYYVVIRETGKPWATYPANGDRAPTKITPDASPPVLPADPTAADTKSYRVRLAWQPATDDLGVASYRVYRGPQAKSADEANLLGEAKADQTEFDDNKPPAGESVWYSVQPIDVAGRAGEVRTLKVDVPMDIAPENKLALAATAGSKAVVLSWTGEPEPDVTQLLVFRSGAADGELAQVAEVEWKADSAARWLDQGVEADTTYRYVLKLKDAGGHISEPTAEVKAAAGGYLRRINSGGPEVAAVDGTPWEADMGNTAGTGRFNFKDKIAGVSDELQPVYTSERWSYQRILYKFDVEPGRYAITLHFAETNPNFNAKGKRVFHVLVNDEQVQEGVDVFDKAGAATGWQLPFEVDVASKELVVELRKVKNGPAIKGIEVRALPK